MQSKLARTCNNEEKRYPRCCMEFSSRDRERHCLISPPATLKKVPRFCDTSLLVQNDYLTNMLWRARWRNFIKRNWQIFMLHFVDGLSLKKQMVDQKRKSSLRYPPYSKPRLQLISIYNGAIVIQCCCTWVSLMEVGLKNFNLFEPSTILARDASIYWDNNSRTYSNLL